MKTDAIRALCSAVEEIVERRPPKDPAEYELWSNDEAVRYRSGFRIRPLDPASAASLIPQALSEWREREQLFLSDLWSSREDFLVWFTATRAKLRETGIVPVGRFDGKEMGIAEPSLKSACEHARMMVINIGWAIDFALRLPIAAPQRASDCTSAGLMMAAVFWLEQVAKLVDRSGKLWGYVDYEPKEFGLSRAEAVVQVALERGFRGETEGAGQSTKKMKNREPNQKDKHTRLFPFKTGNTKRHNAPRALRILRVLLDEMKKKDGLLQPGDLSHVFHNSISDEVSYELFWKRSRFWSAAAWEVALEGGTSSGRKLKDEHFVPRHWVTEEVIRLSEKGADWEHIEAYVRRHSDTCLVTTSEDGNVGKKYRHKMPEKICGRWARYTDHALGEGKGIRILDLPFLTAEDAEELREAGLLKGYDVWRSSFLGDPKATQDMKDRLMAWEDHMMDRLSVLSDGGDAESLCGRVLRIEWLRALCVARQGQG